MAHRDCETEEILRLLEAGKSIQMLAPRRVGKTWLMHEVERQLKQQGWLTIFSDVEGMANEEEFLRDLCKKIEDAGSLAERARGQILHRLEQLTTASIEGGNLIGAIGRVDVKQFSEALVASLHEQNAKVLILIDEISLFVSALISKGPEAAQAFLYHLRKLRQSYPNVRWLLTGSIGLDVVARRLGLGGALIDLEIFPLEPFSAQEARAFIDALCAGRKVRWRFVLDDAGFDYLAAELGWLSPYYLELIANRIRLSSNDGGATAVPTIADIDRAFDELLGHAYRNNFVAWEEHLNKNFPKPDTDVLYAILDCCCGARGGEIASTILAGVNQRHPAVTHRDLMNLMTALANDGFVTETEGRWRFRSGLLRRYWLKYIHA
ncbi:hypothetical protein DNX69_02190 [Rhodopseudomonas palustris]|uniref:ORC1/DEAH AAA+ ATPase domain-containing protein n=1 Tax=Rhodopseudomonas palustris TaxID=1076 RepID=A0A323UZ82_RHOPL|nr:AAA family ATPase [Rhodopseudomonas palustris]PZA13208.1 hypothetical protein DNX69_02190 [Rhodopseudomonas palustris]